MIYANVDWTATTEEQCVSPTLRLFYTATTKPDNMNGGLYFIRSSTKVQQVFIDVIQAYTTQKVDDQKLINNRMRSDRLILFRGLCKPQPVSKNRATLTYCMLDNCEFAQGPWRNYTLYLSSTKQRGVLQYAVHANSMIGHDTKKNALIEQGLWLYKNQSRVSEVHCAPMPLPQV